ncbi:MAG: ATP-binding protein, partial [Dehalococcoidia bacterium]|nr:ATP-binding protein [Dehalococcoidia bacterium]
ATVAIMRYHLLDIRIMVRKSVAYLLTSTVVAIPYVGVIILFNIYFQENLPIWAQFILLFGLALVLQAVWQRVQNLVDRWFYRERYDFLQELEHFSQEAHDISNLGELGSSLVSLISRAFQTTNVHLLLMNEAGNLRTVAFTGNFSRQISFYRRSLLIQWFGKNRGILLRQQLELDPQLQSLTAREKADIDDGGIELFIPLKTNTGELVGLQLMGPKRSEQPYSDEDLRRILTVTSRMAVELENARLYALETSMRMELQRQNEQKTEFLHHVAHELKTPLTAVISSSELMTADSIVNIPFEQRERLLNNINRSAWLMDKKVSELLDLARIQIGRVELDLEPLDLHGVIDDLTSQLSSLFKNKEQSIETQVDPSLPLVKADKERTTEIILNLLSNANKFSPAGGHILVLAHEQDGNMVQVEVKDTAPVINEEDRARIFDPYYRGGTAEDQQRVSGLGLGLAISKSLVTLQQGEIGVSSEEGKGNIFYFTLPIWKEEESSTNDFSSE